LITPADVMSAYEDIFAPPLSPVKQAKFTVVVGLKCVGIPVTVLAVSLLVAEKLPPNCNVTTLSTTVYVTVTVGEVVHPVKVPVNVPRFPAEPMILNCVPS